MARRLIAVDVGNTSTAVGLWSAGRVTRVFHCDDGFPGASKAVRELAERYGASGIGYSSVVPKADAKWRAFARSLDLPLSAVRPELFPLKLDYPDPSSIGADRLADAAGAVERYGAPALVMDFGTALTAAVVTRDKIWRGGVIAPGFPLMRDYLFERTAKLPRMELGSGRAPKIGRSTAEAMRFGAIVGYRGMVREIVAELTRNFREDFNLVATGGFAKWVLRDLDLPFVVDQTLTLYGTGLLCAKEL
ncbi:MAG: type III pantothenate kinase [Kiritimatiellae bacterium]|nr:type III pantothenate kinase [Kiritimatiellia bacterium]